MRNLHILILIFIIGCTSEVYTAPVGPAGSWWLGGEDGGVFVDIKDNNNINDDLYTGTIYFDADQTVWYQGAFKLIGHLNFEVNNHSHYLFWDGEFLYLTESSYLKTVNPISPL